MSVLVKPRANLLGYLNKALDFGFLTLDDMFSKKMRLITNNIIL